MIPGPNTSREVADVSVKSTGELLCDTSIATSEVVPLCASHFINDLFSHDTFLLIAKCLIFICLDTLLALRSAYFSSHQAVLDSV